MQTIKQESSGITKPHETGMSAITGFMLGLLVCGTLLIGAWWWNSRLDNSTNSETVNTDFMQQDNIRQADDNRKTNSPIYKEAKTVAQKYWDARFTKCGEYWYEFDYPNQTPILLRQLKNVTVTTTEETLSDVDKMNGLEWKGITKVDASMNRGIAVQNLPNAHWIDWREGMPAGGLQNFIHVQKKQGSWSFDPDNRGFFKRINCSSIPR
jgi:hypothetical protein